MLRLRGESKTIEELARIVGPIARRHKVLRVSLFGSRARGDFNRNSDYDFLVLFDDSADLCDVGWFRLELEEALGKPVDFAFEDAVGDRFRSIVRDELVHIYG